MTVMRWILLCTMMCLLPLAGCQTHQATRTEVMNAAPPLPPAHEPVPDETIQRIHRLAPDAIIGRVVDELPDEHLVKVGRLDVSETTLDNVHVGDVVTFYGAGDVDLGGGTVVNIVNQMLHVQYPEPSGHRAPMPGDIAILFGKNNK